jgi:hypothetical protein
MRRAMRSSGTGVGSELSAAQCGHTCSQAFRFKVGDDVVDQDGERCRVVSVDTEDFEKPYELEYPNGVKFWATESALTADATVRPTAQPRLPATKVRSHMGGHAQWFVWRCRQAEESPSSAEKTRSSASSRLRAGASLRRRPTLRWRPRSRSDLDGRVSLATAPLCDLCALTMKARFRAASPTSRARSVTRCRNLAPSR